MWSMGVTNYMRTVQRKDITEPFSTLASVSLGVSISSSTETLICFSEREELISLVLLAQNSILDNLHKKLGCHVA
jgi:hypothetical protein